MAFGGFDQRGSGQAPMAEINTTPLVDVMLVLLVIFIITAPLLTHAIKLDLPTASAPPAAEKPETIALSIDAAGRVYWNDEPLADAAALDARLAEAAGRKPEPELHLRADRETRYQRIAEVMSAAQKSGIGKIGFVTEPGRESVAPGMPGPAGTPGAAGNAGPAEGSSSPSTVSPPSTASPASTSSPPSTAPSVSTVTSRP